MTTPREQYDEAIELLKIAFGASAENYDSTRMIVLDAHEDYAREGACPRCKSPAGQACDDRDDYSTDYGCDGESHRERWEAVCPELFSMLNQGVYWLEYDTTEDGWHPDGLYKRTYDEAPENVRESFLILLRGIRVSV